MSESYEEPESIRAEDFEFLEFINANTEQVFSLFDCSKENGQFTFEYRYWRDQGIVLLHFLPHGLARWSKKTANDVIRQTLELTYGESAANEELDDELILTVAGMLAISLIQMMYRKASSLLVELDEEMVVFLRGILLSWLDGPSKANADSTKDVERLAKKLISERKQFLKASIANFAGSPKQNELRPNYDTILSIWQNARTTYRSIKKLSTWQAMIEAGFRGNALPIDLIALLSGNPDDLQTLPLELREPAEKATQGGEDYSKPSHLALEHAARLSGYKPFQLSPRHIRKLMSQKRSVKSTEKHDTD